MFSQSRPEEMSKMRGCRLDDRASSAFGLDLRSFEASHQDITVSFLVCVFHSVLLKLLCMCVFLIKNKRTTTTPVYLCLPWLKSVSTRLQKQVGLYATPPIGCRTQLNITLLLLQSPIVRMESLRSDDSS